MDELIEMRATDQRVASLEHDARQTHLAVEADGQAGTKTRERTEGAKAVQAMHGNSFSANRIDPDPMCSTSVGVKVEFPTLPCRGDVVVENGAAAPKISRPWRCAHQEPLVAYSPLAKPLRQRTSPSTTQLFGSA